MPDSKNDDSIESRRMKRETYSEGRDCLKYVLAFTHSPLLLRAEHTGPVDMAVKNQEMHHVTKTTSLYVQ